MPSSRRHPQHESVRHSSAAHGHRKPERRVFRRARTTGVLRRRRPCPRFRGPACSARSRAPSRRCPGARPSRCAGSKGNGGRPAETAASTCVRISWAASNVVTGVTVPPEAEILEIGLVGWPENRITSSWFQVPPRPAGASASVWGVPPLVSTLLSLPAAKNAMKRPSATRTGMTRPRYRRVVAPARCRAGEPRFGMGRPWSPR